MHLSAMKLYDADSNIYIFIIRFGSPRNKRSLGSFTLPARAARSAVHGGF
jgi:hypothetical protein